MLGFFFQPYVDWFTGEKMAHPIKDNPAAKSSFMPSKWEHKRVRTSHFANFTLIINFKLNVIN